MPIRSFKTLDGGDYIQETIQSNTGQALKDISNKAIVDGTLIESVALIAGQDNMIAHKLGRPLKFWVLARQNTNTTVWETTSTNPEFFLTLRCGSNCTVNLWVG